MFYSANLYFTLTRWESGIRTRQVEYTTNAIGGADLSPPGYDLETFGFGVDVFGVVGIGFDSGLVFGGETVGDEVGMGFASGRFGFGTEAVLVLTCTVGIEDDEDDEAAGAGGGGCGVYVLGTPSGGAFAAFADAAIPLRAASVSPTSSIAVLLTFSSRLRAMLVIRYVLPLAASDAAYAIVKSIFAW
eukprot:s3529_g3.t1